MYETLLTCRKILLILANFGIINFEDNFWTICHCNEKAINCTLFLSSTTPLITWILPLYHHTPNKLFNIVQSIINLQSAWCIGKMQIIFQKHIKPFSHAWFKAKDSLPKVPKLSSLVRCIIKEKIFNFFLYWVVPFASG